jgi:hypothetical protein
VASEVRGVDDLFAIQTVEGLEGEELEAGRRPTGMLLRRAPRHGSTEDYFETHHRDRCLAGRSEIS